MEMNRSKRTNLNEGSKVVCLSLENLKLKIERNHTNRFTYTLRLCKKANMTMWQLSKYYFNTYTVSQTEKNGSLQS